MKSKSMWFLALGIAVVSTGLLSSGIYADPSEQQVLGAAKLANEVYTDPKGYFKIRPPAGWAVEEYAADPRGKVNFNCTEGGRKAQLKVIGAASPFADFDELFQGAENARERLRARVGGTHSVETTTLLGQKAALSLTSLANGFKQYLVELIAGGNQYALAFGTADQEVYEKYLPLAKASMETLEPLPKAAKPEDARAHTIASKIRLAQVHMQIGRKDWALTAINEGLAIDPKNQQLLRLKKEAESTQKPTEEPALAKEAYTDPKGFFKIIPPQGWQKQEYPQDPRGKVAFIAPVSQTDLRVLAKAVDIPDYETLIRNLKDKEKQLGVEMNIEPTVFNRMPAVKRLATITMQGVTLKFLWIDLLIDGVSHNIQYSAPPSLFEKHRDTAWKSMLTYQPLKRGKPASPEEARRHEAAKWIRLAKIALEMGNTQAAKDAVAAGLEVDPENTELKQMKADLEKK